jgi:hypothetical protein
MHLAISHVVQAISESFSVSINEHCCRRVLLPSFGSHSSQHGVWKGFQKDTRDFVFLAANVEASCGRHSFVLVLGDKLAECVAKARGWPNHFGVDFLPWNVHIENLVSL